MVTPDQHAELRRRVKVWRGPPERDLARHPEDLLAIARSVHADGIIVDSLKDAAIGLTDDEVGAGWNRAERTASPWTSRSSSITTSARDSRDRSQRRSTTCTALPGSRPAPVRLCCGWGSPGDAVVELVHLKQPVATVGPLKIEHDHRSGTSVVAESFDLLRVLRSMPNGLSAPEAARAWFDTERPDDNERRRAKRALDGLVTKGTAVRRDAREGGSGGTDAARYYAMTDRVDEAS